jgi:prepilin-type N-terminal cleavage/methylation domain-containing protein
MALNNKRVLQKGFTIVELLIVIVVIGILASLVINSFSGTQAKARDTERETDIATLSGHLESFYTDKGYYPTYIDLNNIGWVQANLRGLDPNALKNPSDTSSGDTSIVRSPTPDQHQYGYLVYDKSDEECIGQDADCGTRYVLYYLAEQSGSLKEHSSLN